MIRSLIRDTRPTHSYMLSRLAPRFAAPSRAFSRKPLVVKMGVDIEIKKPGDGVNYPKSGDVVKAHYVGTLLDGTKFDSSRDRGKPFQFTIGQGQVIKGWDEGIAKMSIGELSVLTCSPDYAYGSRGAGGVIPPNATLKFEVELIAIN